ncbi:MAG: uroporphyrinogen-III C-methyltransferase [Desulfurivibrionaceae bacterium]
MKKGKAYLVGAGPGDPSLITLRGLEVLKRAEVVIYDYLAGVRLLEYASQDAEFIYAGKKGGVHHTHTQEEINQMLIDRVRKGKRVVRLKGGDPFIYGRGGEELEVLSDAGLDFEAVPGVTSASAAATFAGIPITHRDYTSSVAYITGHENPDKDKSRIDWARISTGIGTLVFYMGIKNLASITANLIKHGRAPETPVAVVRWASTPHQRSVVGTLADIADIVIEEGIKPPALTIVGDVVNLRHKINWYEIRPLFNRKIVVTRTRDKASELVALLEEQGANCLEFATIAIEPPDSWDEADKALAGLDKYQWVLFTSLNAVDYFFKRLYDKGLDCRALKGCRVAAVGRVTADRLKEYGLVCDLLPEKYTGEGLAAVLEKEGVKGDNILLPRAVKAREVLPDRLRLAGAAVTIVPVYQNVIPEGRNEFMKNKLLEKDIDMVTFTSSSTVTNFINILGINDTGELQRLMEGVKIAAIGPITAETVREMGLKVDVQPEKHTIPDMVRSIVSYYSASCVSDSSEAKIAIKDI